MKPYGIAINGCIDGFSRHIMWMEAYYTNSDPKVIADYFINTVTHIGGCPQRVRAGCWAQAEAAVWLSWSRQILFTVFLYYYDFILATL